MFPTICPFIGLWRKRSSHHRQRRCPYNPDWAFVTDRDEKLYFVQETKSTLDSEDRRTKENQKIACGRRHFETLGVDYEVVTSLSEVGM